MSPQEFNKFIVKAGQHIINNPPKTRTYTLSIKKRFEGRKLLDVYTESFPHVEKSFWEEKISQGNLTLNNKPTSVDTVVIAGQITQHKVPCIPEPEVSFEVKLLADEGEYWILSKPSPLPMHSGGRYLNHNLTTLLKTAFPKKSIHVVNRLDANTTGIVVVALNKAIAFQLGEQFRTRTVKKQYLALVEGLVSQSNFSSSKSISKEKTPAGGRKIEDGFESYTEFETLHKYEDKTLLCVKPQSGRTNQIRLHLADLNHPIIGDLGYKNPDYFQSNPLTYPSDSLFLHAWKLTILHPTSLSPIQYSAPTNQKWEEFTQFIND